MELPELDNGPHFFYGLQWWFFGLLALGRLRLSGLRRVAQRAVADRASTQRARSMPPSTGSIDPDTNDEAGDSTKAAARPNSSGSP